MRRTRTSRTTITAAAATLLLATAACSSVYSGGPAPSDGLPDVVEVVSLNPTTGVVAFVGDAANKGYQLAVDQINEQDFLEGSRIELELVDTKSEPQTAAQEMTKVTVGGDVSAVFGSVSSNEALAMSPLAERSELPVIYTQAGSDGVLNSDYTWRATPLMREYYPALSRYIEETGARSLGILDSEANPTVQDIGTNTLPAMAEELGIEVTGSVGTQATTQDFSAPINQVLAGDPDLVAVLLVGAANPTAMTQLRQAGYDGPVLGNAGASGGSLDPAGEDGVGMVWASNFHHQMEAASSQAFVAAYREEYGEDPLAYAAEAYDAAWFLARALKEAGSADRISVKDGMLAVADQPVDGALGEQISWTDRQIVTPGVVVEYSPDGEALVYEASAD